MTNPIEIYEQTKRDMALLIVAYYRGAWCPICAGWLREWLKIKNFGQQLKTSNAALIVVSSQKQNEVDGLMKNLGFDALDGRVVGIGDPKNTLASKLRNDGLLNITITGFPGPYVTHGHQYPYGMAQPGCLVYKTNDSSSALYSWATVPKMRNFQGATARPSPHQIWEYVTKKMQSNVDEKMKKPKKRSMRWIAAAFGRN